MVPAERRFGRKISAPPKAAIKAQVRALMHRDAVHEVLKEVLGERELEWIYPESVRVAGDIISVEVKKGAGNFESVRISISERRKLKLSEHDRATV